MKRTNHLNKVPFLLMTMAIILTGWGMVVNNAEAQSESQVGCPQCNRRFFGCSDGYDPRPYRPGARGWTEQIGRIQVRNPYSTPVRVTLYHPDDPSRQFRSWNIQPGATVLLGEDNYGMDWGVQINESSKICILGLAAAGWDDQRKLFYLLPYRYLQ